MVETVFKSFEGPCFKSRVTVPVEVGLHVILAGVPAVKPEVITEVMSKGLAPCAETKATIPAKTSEVENCILTEISICLGKVKESIVSRLKAFLCCFDSSKAGVQGGI